ncbi:MAG: CPBP family intramembrane metalloprotease [Clostridia bacterium]|nr:CPBP family intramembrane metalloprotease [Clostridia bacterium]
MLKKLYDKSKIWFAVAWIIAYCVLMSLGDSISSIIGVEKSITLPIGVVLSIVLMAFLRKNGLFEEYGICPSRASMRSMLYYVPVLVMMTTNLWYGVTVNYGALETILYILSMLCVGLLEEVIFRGLLFEAMRPDGFKTAVIVSSLTFGIGHIVNLINGSGAELVPNLLQVVYATSAGFMFVMIYCKTKSLVGCIVIHGVFNSLSVFADENGASSGMRVLFCLILALITAAYGAYLALSLAKEREMNKTNEKAGRNDEADI